MLALNVWSRWRWASGYASVCCALNCIQGMFLKVHEELCDEDLRGTRDYHERLQIPHDPFSLALAPSHLLA
jgi:hypothetical protein